MERREEAVGTFPEKDWSKILSAGKKERKGRGMFS